ncbi:MAG: chemotaxis protein CheW [Planctomycetota bacterium]
MIDLRRKLGMSAAEHGPATCIVVVEVQAADDVPFEVGCIVDSVHEVIAIGSENVGIVPRCGNAPWHCLLDMTKIKDRVLFLLDLDRVLQLRASAADGPVS